MAKKFVPGQLGLFMPVSDWVAPTELPDLRRYPIAAVDLENKDDGLSNGMGPGWPFPLGYICGVAWAVEGRSGYIPLNHPDSQCFPRENVMRWATDMFKSETRIVFHNAPYDTGWFGTYGVDSPVNMEDTLPACVMLDETKRTFSLDACCARHGIKGKDTNLLADAVEAFGGNRRKPQADLWRLPARYVGPYAEADAVGTLALWHQIEAQLKTQDIWEAYRTEIDLIPMVVAMRRRGIRIDPDLTHKTIKDFRSTSGDALKEIGRLVGLRRPVTMEEIRSPVWLEATFKNEKIPFPRTSGGKTGRTQGSFSADWMEKYDHPLPQMLVKARKFEEAASKFLETFILGFSHRGRIHSEIHQFLSEEGGTRSQRFSYSEPPLQQMNSPDKDPRDEQKNLIEDSAVGTKIRRCFLPEKGTYWGAADYCYDDKTEILTQTGWKLFKDLLPGEKVAQWQSGIVSFVEPLDYFVGDDKARKMVSVRGVRQIDFCVTQAHRCLILDKNNKEKIVAGAELSAATKGKYFPQAGLLLGGRYECEDLLALTAALQADAADRKTTWRLYLSKTRKIERLVRILERLGLDYSITPEAKGDQASIVIKDRSDLRRYLKDGKVFDIQALLGLSQQSRRFFYNETFFWDGTGNGYGSTVQVNVEIVQILATLDGRRAGVSCYPEKEGKKPFYTVTVGGRAKTHVMPNTEIKEVDYTGCVYCVTVPSGMILTRRNGRVIVSGNSQQEPRITVHFAAVCKMPGADAALQRYRDNARTDYHTMVADMTGLVRPRAKILNLAMTYGKGKRSTAIELNVSMEEAEQLLKEYHARLPFIKSLEDLAKSMANSRGYIRLIDGARMHYPDWEGGYMDSDDRHAAIMLGKRLDACSLEEARERQKDPEHPWSKTRLRRADTRKALNNLIQGSAARQTKRAMREMYRQGILPLLQMHDELDYPADCEKTTLEVERIMVETTPLVVPTVVDNEFGRNWGEAKLSWRQVVEKYGDPSGLAPAG